MIIEATIRREKLMIATIANINNKLSYESWEDVFAEKGTNTAFNIFLNIYLTIFHSSFPVKKLIGTGNKAWLIPGPEF
jgi:hypothetical protein